MLNWLTEMIKPGDPGYGQILMEIRKLDSYGVEITQDIIRNVICEIQGSDQPIRGQAPNEPSVLPQDGSVIVQDEVVYYIRIGNRIKIGTSVNFPLRMAQLNPEEIMAIESGGYTLEHHRHRQFADIRVHGEWFAFDAKLKAHMDQVRQNNPVREHIIDAWASRCAG